jgi:hypothetical protein
MIYKTCSLCGKKSNSKYCSECINSLIHQRKTTIIKNIEKQSGHLKKYCFCGETAIRKIFDTWMCLHHFVTFSRGKWFRKEIVDSDLNKIIKSFKKKFSDEEFINDLDKASTKEGLVLACVNRLNRDALSNARKWLSEKEFTKLKLKMDK